MTTALSARLLSRLTPLALTMTVVTGCGLSQASPACPASSTPTAPPQLPIDPQPVLDCLHGASHRPDAVATLAGASATPSPTAEGNDSSFPPPGCHLVRMDGKALG